LLVAVEAAPFDRGYYAGAVVFGLSAAGIGREGDAGVDEGEWEAIGLIGEGIEFDPALAGSEPEE